MDHRAFIQSLSPDFKQSLTLRSDLRGLLHMTGHIGLILVLMFVVMRGGWAGWLALIPLGIALVFLFTLEHEATHKTPFRSDWLNELVGHACGIILFQPFLWFRYFHLAHHKFTNDPLRDPELLAGAKPDGWQAYLVHISGVPVLFGSLRQILRNALGTRFFDYVPASGRNKVIWESRAYILIYAAVFSSLLFSDLVFWIWILPLILGQPFLRLYLLAEHGRCAFVANMFENTRTTFTNRVIRFLAWNMPYHTEHHCFPNVPFHKLPILHKRMADHLRQTSDGYLTFHQDLVGDFKS